MRVNTSKELKSGKVTTFLHVSFYYNTIFREFTVQTNYAFFNFKRYPDAMNFFNACVSSIKSEQRETRFKRLSTKVVFK